MEVRDRERLTSVEIELRNLQLEVKQLKEGIEELKEIVSSARGAIAFMVKLGGMLAGLAVAASAVWEALRPH